MFCCSPKPPPWEEARPYPSRSQHRQCRDCGTAPGDRKMLAQLFPQQGSSTQNLGEACFLCIHPIGGRRRAPESSRQPQSQAPGKPCAPGAAPCTAQSRSDYFSYGSFFSVENSISSLLQPANKRFSWQDREGSFTYPSLIHLPLHISKGTP